MSKATVSGIRNVAIIAHVDHGKTTLTDAMFRQSGMFREGQEVDDRLLDSMELERERGITIAAKNCSVAWQGVKINIVDTPGHADFGGEVERSLSMADGALLLVDASEGPLPQTRFVLSKALERGLKLIVVVNKIDRADARPDEVLNEVYDLFIDLDAGEEQLEFPVLYAVGKQGIASADPKTLGTDLAPLFAAILEHIPGPSCDPDAPFAMLVSDLGYSDYLGRLAIGKAAAGTAHAQDRLVRIDKEDKRRPLTVSKLQTYEGLRLVDAEAVAAGDIVVLSGVDEVRIGDTICSDQASAALPRIAVSEPTVAMRFSINTSPLAGREGKLVQSTKIRERLEKEALRNVAIRIEPAKEKDTFLVKGRGEFQMAILVETMRREGFELSVGRPEVIFRRDDKGKLLEPIEKVFIDCEEGFMGVVTEKLSQRKGRMNNLVNHGSGRVRMEFSVPSRGLIGYRDEFLTDTKGHGHPEHLLRGVRGASGRFSGPFHRLHRGRPHWFGRGLRPVQPGAARAAVHRPQRAGVRGHDRGRAQPGRGHRRQRLQGEEALQHARLGQGRGRGAHLGAAHDPGAGHPFHPRGRTGGGHAREHPPA